MENLSVLTGKYGEEGDQLLYKILDSGDFLKKSSIEDYQAGPGKLLPFISSKGLRYDLTVPFARYVAMNRHQIVFPFKRYQMQPVWRADRPQKGRYREFYQCDADIVGTNSLLCEAEIIAMINEVFSNLGIDDFTIQVNHRQVLTGFAEVIGAAGRQNELAVSLDKLSKIGPEKVLKELAEKGFNQQQLEKLEPLFQWQGDWESIESHLAEFLDNSTVGSEGLADLAGMFSRVQKLVDGDPKVTIKPSLARGLAYYTGAIFEVVVNNAQIGSVCGGGRYDDLTGIFGLSDVSGVGISFGVDRIYDVMKQLRLFPEKELSFSQVLIVALDDESESYALSLLAKLRFHDVAAELYPDRVKLKKPLNYADKNGVPMVILVGPDEISSGLLTVKNMSAGTQQQLTEPQLLSLFKGEN
jgi:histidyl-tRNA synthetase